MKSVKLLLLALLFSIGATAQFSYVQQMAYKDYSVYSQMNIGKGKLSNSHPSAILDLGDSVNSRKGLLFPRGNKDSVYNPAKGLVIFDTPSGKLYFFNGTAWAPLGAAANAITGSGTGGRLALWNSGNTLTSSVIRDNGTNVGVGVDAHAVFKLYVNGHGYFMGNIGALAGVHTGPNWRVMVDDNGYFRYEPDAGLDTTIMATVAHVQYKIDSLAAAYTDSFDATTPSTSSIEGLNGVILGTYTVKDALQQLIYPALPPTASLSITFGGFVTKQNWEFEYMAPGDDLVVTLNWTAGRQSNTAPLDFIDVDGGLQTFTQPPQNGSVSGSISKTIQRNTFKIFHSDVFATDGKVAYGNSVINWYYKRYWGFVSSTNPSDAAIRAGAQEFINQRTQSLTAPYNPTGSQYFYIAFPQSYDGGNTSQIWIGGLDQTASFTRSVRSFTNASGATTNYIIYVSNSPTSGAVSYEIK